MSFLDGFQKAISRLEPYDQNTQNTQKSEIDDQKGIFGDFGNIGNRLPAEKVDADNQPDPRSIEYALTLLVDCPRGMGKLHCWYCAQCEHTSTCYAWHIHFHKVKQMQGRGKPYSLLILEVEGMTEMKQ